VRNVVADAPVLELPSDHPNPLHLLLTAAGFQFGFDSKPAFRGRLMDVVFTEPRPTFAWANIRCSSQTRTRGSPGQLPLGENSQIRSGFENPQRFRKFTEAECETHPASADWPLEGACVFLTTGAARLEVG
jgi:hypothetical protein